MFDKVRAKGILAFDWDARTLRVVHAFTGKRGVTVDRLLSVAIPPDVDTADPQQMGMHIRRILDQEGIRTKHAVVDIPRDQVILNTLTLPCRLPEELPDMVEMQIAKELAFPVGEAAIDFTVGSTDEEGVTAEVLVAAIRREVLQQYVATFDKAGLKLDRVGLRPYANKVAVCELLRHGMPDRVLMIDVRPTLTEINVLRRSTLAFSRAASVLIPEHLEDTPHLSITQPVGPVDGIDAGLGAEGQGGIEGVVQSLIVEVARSLEAYRTGDAAAQIDHVVIAGAVGVEEALADAIQARFGITTEMYNPASTFGWEPDEGANASAFAATLGLVLGHADTGLLHFDFLHPKRRISETRKHLRTVPKVAAVFLLFLATVVVGFSEYTRASRQDVARIEKDIEELEGRADKNERFLKFVTTIREFDEQLVWVDVLHEIIPLLPSTEELVVEEIKMNQQKRNVTIKTKAKSRETASQVIRRLNEFVPQGRDAPRFHAWMGVQKESKGKGEEYTYQQSLSIEIIEG